MFFRRKKKINKTDEIVKKTINDVTFLQQKFDSIETKRDALFFLDLLKKFKIEYLSLIKKCKKRDREFYQVVIDYIEAMDIRGLLAYDEAEFDGSPCIDNIVYIDAYTDAYIDKINNDK